MNREITTLRWLLICWMAGIAALDAFGNNLNGEKTMTWSPPMVCNDLVHISLDTLCEATVEPHMLLEDLTGSPLDYRIKLYNANKSEQPDLSFDYTDINKIYEFRIWHLPSGNSCWGKLLIEDKYAPEMLCQSDTFPCGTDLHPLSVGFPIPPAFNVTIDTISPTEFDVYGWDACSVVRLTYRDNFYNNQCDSLCFRRLVRDWVAKDAYGNFSECADTFCLLRPTEADIRIPPNYDDFDLPVLDCDLNFPKLPNGNPSPEYTGFPVPDGCSTLTATFTDLKITTCGNTYKIIRRWVVLNWCTGTLTQFNQLIKVADHTAPIVECPADFTVGMKLYSCESEGRLPPPDTVIDCNTWTYEAFTVTIDPITGDTLGRTKDYLYYDPFEKVYYLRGAPEGRIWIIYVVTDACGNSTECDFEVGVIDNLVPIPICDQKTVVALGIDGTAKVYAETYDDQSLDNCGIDTFLVRRMDDPCNNGTNFFGPYVSFCCEDVGKTILVALEVYDLYGNKNTCMIETVVQDKEPPIIVPPTDITVSCTFPIDLDDLSNFGTIRLNEADRKEIIIADLFYVGTNFVAGIDGIAYDNCEVIITDTTIVDIKCSSGTIRRIFTATDRQGLSRTVEQVITIINTNPFSGFDIFWPPNIEIFSCNNAVTHPDQTGRPFYFNTTCAQIAANYDDTRLTTLDSSCYKILRKWYVVDWCQYDRNNNLGYWEYIQVIAVKDNVAPVITSCSDIEICDQSAFSNPNTGQCMASFQIQGTGTDDCTEPHNLIWKYRIDENNDGSFGPIINGNIASGVLPIGVHRLRWILTDQCGNISTCDQVFTLRDCKKPTPYCVNGLVTVIMPSTGSIAVNAKNLNIGSFDNCTAPKDLKFTFTVNINDTVRIYDCDSLFGNSSIIKTVRIYVTDEYGNQDYCETNIRIQDNDGNCAGSKPGFNLSGKIRNGKQLALPGTTIDINDRAGNLINQTESDFEGKYAFQNIKITDFYLKAVRADVITNGVSTLDILFIQRHILGIQTLNSPYKLLAADVNSTNTITAKDISDLRRAILGIIGEFPNQTPIWKFIKADHQFANPEQPWDAPNKIESNQLQDLFDNVNFLGIKTGDVDLSASANFGNSTEFRNKELVQWNYKVVNSTTNNTRVIEVYANAPVDMQGFQAIFELQNKSLNILEIKPGAIQINEGEYFMENDRLKISCALAQSRQVNTGDLLFSMVMEGNPSAVEMKNPIQLIPDFSNEVYYNDEGYKLVIRNVNEQTQSSGLIAYPVQPNPFSDEAQIRFEIPTSGNVNLQVYDLTGRLVFKKEVNGVKGKNEIQIQGKELNSKGLMYYVLTTPFGSVSERMFVIE